MRTPRLTSSGLLLAALLLSIGSPVFSATFTVDSTADIGDASPGDGVCDTGAGACTLRAAIQEANALAGADEITLLAGTYTITIAGHSENGNAATGDLDIGTEIVITGAGSATTIIDGGALDRVFDFQTATAGFSAEINGVTIQNGDVSGIAGVDGVGGGLSVFAQFSSKPISVDLTDVVVSGNTAEANGCGIYVGGVSTVTIESSRIEDHDCPDVSGGAIRNQGSLTIRNSTLQRNVGSSGGAIYAFGSQCTTTIEDSLLTNNTALAGGAYYNGSDCPLWVRDTTMSLNTSTSTGGYGGGAVVVSGFSEFERASLIDNTAAWTGGALAGDGTLNIYDSTFSGNTAEYAGAIYHYAGSGDAVEFRNATISGNSAAFYSGGVYLGASSSGSPTHTINNSTFAANAHPTGVAGSNLYLSRAVPSISNSIIAGGIGGVSCSSDTGGALSSVGYNLDDGTSCGLSGTGDQSSATPDLGPLADNGGPTQTHALLASSDAIDAGDPADPGTCETADQRGAPRPIDGDGDMTARCDAGAYELAPSADLGISKDDGSASAVPGTSVVYTLVVDNAGPDNATGVTVTDVLDGSVFDVASATFTCTVGVGSGPSTDCPASGTGADLAAGISVDLEAGDSVTIEVTAPVLPEATGTADNTATVSGGAFDTNELNNSATDSNTLTPQADLSISKDDGVSEAVPGEQVVYTITASNAGPSDAPGALVSDSFAEDLSCSSTCAGAGGGSCAPGPFLGSFDETVDLPAGGSVVFTATCSIDAGATGSLANTATVTAPVGVTDENSPNDSATDTDTLTPEADLTVSKGNGVTQVEIGGETTYVIVGSNFGPSDSPGATIADTFPAALSCLWTCVGGNGGSCTAGPAMANIADSVDLPAGATVTYTAVCSVDAMAEGQLVNTATIAVPGGVTETAPGDNSATDSDLLVGECGFPNNLTLANHTTDGAEVYTACLTITVGPSMTVSATGSMTARAGASVTFLDGVGVQTGGSMSIEIDADLLPPIM